MEVVLHHIGKREGDRIELAVSFGRERPQSHCATCVIREESKFTFVDDELFMRLSDAAYKRFGNCIVYQIELMRILHAFVKGEDLPELPAVLGATSFGAPKPRFSRMIWNTFTAWRRGAGVLRGTQD